MHRTFQIHVDGFFIPSGAIFLDENKGHGAQSTGMLLFPCFGEKGVEIDAPAEDPAPLTVQASGGSLHDDGLLAGALGDEGGAGFARPRMDFSADDDEICSGGVVVVVVIGEEGAEIGDFDGGGFGYSREGGGGTAVFGPGLRRREGQDGTD